MTAAQVVLESPHRFKERLLLFGGGGVGKTTAVLSVARRVPEAHFYVLDTDVSAAYDRALALDYPDVDDRQQLTVLALDDWNDFGKAIQLTIDTGDQNTDWLVIDNVTWTWATVQSWMSERIHGTDPAEFMAQLRAETIGNKSKDGVSTAIGDFNRALTEGMSWPIINKEYQRHVVSKLHRWHGHVILTAEAAEVRRTDDEETRLIYSTVGVKPAGQKSLHHLMATNLFMFKRGQDDYRMTAVKDRNREPIEKQPVDDFALDYLRDVAGWGQKLWRP